MTCADKLRDLHAEIEHWRTVDVLAKRDSLSAARLLQQSVDALPEIAAVIEAAAAYRAASEWVLTCLDINEMKHAQKKYDAAQEQYDAADAALSARLDGAS